MKTQNLYVNFFFLFYKIESFLFLSCTNLVSYVLKNITGGGGRKTLSGWARNEKRIWKKFQIEKKKMVKMLGIDAYIFIRSVHDVDCVNCWTPWKFPA